VQAKHGVHRKLLEQAVGHHHRRPSLRLLGRLEDEMHAAVEIKLVHVLGHVARGAKQHRRMAVVTTSVHQTCRGRAVGKIVLLEQRQGVHVGAQTDRPRTTAFAQGRNDARTRQPAMDLQPVAAQLARHYIGSAQLIEGKLRVSVQVTPNRRQFAEKRDIKKSHEPDLTKWNIESMPE